MAKSTRKYKDELLHGTALTYPDPRSLIASFRFYFDEHARPKGCDLTRMAAAADNICTFFGAEREAVFKQADIRAYIAHRLAQGVIGASIRRELAWLRASLFHGNREDRLPAPLKIKSPGNGAPRTRFLTEAEVARVMAQPMEHRIRMFFRLAFATGARSKAIEELTWDRCDLVNGLIDYNVPGARRHNKRRAVVPMSNALRRILEAAYDRPTRDRADPYVIGAGARGGPSSTGAECKAAWRSVGIEVDGLNRHCFRKTFVTEKVKAGVPLPIAAVLIADRPETAGKYYMKVAMPDMRDAVNRRAA